MSDSTSPPGLELLLGRCDEVRAECFVRAAPAAGGAPARITGTLTGPRRGRDTTLPATARLQPTAVAGAARALVTEPAYWTPDLPNLYRLEATIERTDEPGERIDRLVGLRRLGVRGRSLWLDGRRWVPRGVAARGADLEVCKSAQVAAVVIDPDEATLVRADELGVAVLAAASVATPDDLATLRRSIAAWAVHPSAVVVVLPPTIGLEGAAAIAAATRDFRGTQLLAARVAGAAPPPDSIPPGIDALVVALDAATMPHEGWRAGAPQPLIAWRDDPAAPIAGRGPADVLQACLAAWGTRGGRDTLAWDWAGYVAG